MKITLALLITLVCANLRAQAPIIDYLQVDEAKSQLWVIGKFGVDSGSVTIEDTTLGIVFWSDTMIVCGLPDSGRGAGGWVRVQIGSGISNQRVLSIFNLKIISGEFEYAGNALGWRSVGTATWYCNWRADINYGHKQIAPFEIGKNSILIDGNIPGALSRGDTNSTAKNAFYLKGLMDIENHQIKDGFGHINGIDQHAPIIEDNITLQPIFFDTTGVITGYRDSDQNASVDKWDFTVSGNILFPPYSKSKVKRLFDGDRDNLVNIFLSNSHSIVIETLASIGEVAVSLFTIDGRLLRKVNIDMATPGSYKFDATGIDNQIGLLVLQTKNGSFAQKIVF